MASVIFDLFARGKQQTSGAFHDVADSVDKAKDSTDGLARSSDRAGKSMGQLRATSVQAAAGIEAAQLKVERATRRVIAAQDKHGKGSLEARDASNRLTQAQLRLEKAQQQTSASAEAAATSTRRYSTAAVTGATVAGVALFKLAKTAVSTASNINESQTKNAVVFGASARAVEQLGETSADALGISKQAALEAAGTFGNLFVSLKLPQAEASKMSVRLVQLASDMASFNDASPQEALDALRSGLVGETEPLRRFGVNMQDAQLRQKALEMGLVSTTKDTLPPAIRAQAAYAMILEQTTTAQGDFERTSDGLANAQRRAKARASDLAAELGTKLLPAARGGTLALLDMADAAQRNSDVLIPAVATVGTLAASVLLVKKAGDGLGAASGGLGKYTAAIRSAEGATGKFRAGVGGLVSAVGGPMNLALAAGAVGVGLLVKSQMDAKRRVDDLTDTLDDQTGAITDNTRAMAFKALQDNGAVDAAKRLDVSLRDLTDASLGNVQAIVRVQDALAAAGQGMNTTTAGARGLNRETVLTGGAIKSVKDAIGGQNSELDKARTKLRDAQQAGVATAGSADTLAASTTNVADAMDKEETNAQRLKRGLDNLTGAHIAADEAAIAWEASLDGLSEAISKNGHTLNINSEKGRDNKKALIDAAQAAQTLMVAMVDEGASVDSVRKKGEKFRDQLIAQADRMGITKTQAQQLIAKYLSFPADVTTTVKADTKTATQHLIDFNRRVLGLSDKNVRITASAIYYGDGSARRIKGDGTLGPIMRAGGGPIDRGSGQRDDVPALLMRDEHVWTRGETAAVGGHGAMYRLRAAARTGQLRGYAAGGEVTGFGPVVRAVDTSMNRLTHRLADSLAKNLDVLGGGAVRGWARQWAVLHRAFPGAQLFSSYRPGAITSSGNVSYHARGRAIDVTPSNAIFDWILRNYGRTAKEVIYSPAGPRQIKNGRPHYYTGQVRADHWDHVHWAMDGGGVANGRGVFAKLTRAPERVLSPRQTIAFERLAGALAGGGRGGVTFVFPNYFGPQDELMRQISELDRQGRLDNLGAVRRGRAA
jgi:hypothetical protein